MQNPNLPTLNVCVGYPYSGKATWALKNNAPIVSPDEIRRHVTGLRFVAEAEGLIWWVARIMVRSLFSVGHREVTLDACSINEARRAYWAKPEWNSRYVVFPADVETCVDRALLLKDEPAILLIHKMAKEHQPLNRQEAFEAIEPESEF